MVESYTEYNRDGTVMGNIHCMDCLDGLPLLHKSSVDMVFADLPYGVTRNVWDCEIDLDNLFDELWRVLKPDGVIIMTAQQPFTSTLVMHQRQYFRYELIWDKVLVSGFLNANRQPLRCHESILIFSRQKGMYNPQKWFGKSKNHSKKVHIPSSNYGKYYFADNSEDLGMMKHPRSIICFEKPHPSVTLHPTQKSLELIRWIIRSYTKKGDLILDPVMGSGTTAEAAIDEKRRFIGFEKEEKYWKLAVERLNKKLCQTQMKN